MLTKTMIERSKRCVCRFCGNKLEIRAVIFNEYGGAGAEFYCGHCDKIEYGTEETIYETAKAFIDALEFNYYWNLPENQKSYELNIAKICEILAWSLQHWQLLDKQGLKERIIFHDDSLLEMEQDNAD